MDYKHQIKVVAKRTGLTPHLIRMWERRYKAVVPVRNATGRRLYSDDDIERLTLLRQATMAGEAIGRIARLSREELVRLVASSLIIEPQSYREQPANLEQAEYHLNQCLEVVRSLDAVNLESCLLRASVSLGQQIFLEQVLQPFLEITGDLWNDGQIKVVHEHLASAIIRSLLGSMFVSMPADPNGPLLLSTTPAGHLHEFGALMVSVMASSLGWRTLYLGPNLPVEDIVAAINQRRADVVSLSMIYPPDDPHLLLELKKLRRLIGERVHILAGGRAALGYAGVLREINAVHITDLASLKAKLDDIRKELLEKQTGSQTIPTIGGQKDDAKI